MKVCFKKGVTILSLVITIIIIIILAATTVSLFQENGLIDKAKANVLKTDLTLFNEELRQKIKVKEIENVEYDSTKIYAQYKEDQEPIDETNIKYWVPSINDEYKDKIGISEGKLFVVNNELSAVEIQAVKDINIPICGMIEASNEEIVINDTTSQYFNNYRIYGNSVQKGTPTPQSPIEIESLGKSKNLFDKDTMLRNYYYINTANSDIEPASDSTTFLIPCKGNTRYTISFDYSILASAPTKIFRTGYIEEDLKTTQPYTTVYELNTNATTYHVLTTSGAAKYIVVQVNTAYENQIKETLQVEEGIIATEYKPYTERYIEIVNSGKNLVNIKSLNSSVSDTNVLVNYTEPITISAKASDDLNFSNAVWRIRVQYKDGTYNWVGDKGYNAGTFPKSFNATSDNPIVKIMYRGVRITNGEYYDIQIEKGTLATEYQKYQEPILTTIDLSGHDFLRKVGDVSDYIDYENQRIVRNIGKYTYTGNEIIAAATLNRFSYTSIITIKLTPLLCTHYSYINDYTQKDKVCTTNGGSTDRIWIRDTTFSTAEEFALFLQEQDEKGIPLTVYYQLKEPAYEPISLPVIRILHGYSTISVRGSTVKPSKIEGTYYSNFEN